MKTSIEGIGYELSGAVGVGEHGIEFVRTEQRYARCYSHLDNRRTVIYFAITGVDGAMQGVEDRHLYPTSTAGFDYGIHSAFAAVGYGYRHTFTSFLAECHSGCLGEQCSRLATAQSAF